MSTHKQQAHNAKKVKTLFWAIPTFVLGILLLIYIFGMGNFGSMMGSHANMGGMQNHMITSEEQFIFEMVPHHQEAVDSARIMAASPTTHSGIKQMSETIVIVQTQEIAQLNEWKEQWYKNSWYRPAYKKMMPDLTKLNGTAQDLAFLNGMIAHHEMAVMMAEQVLKLNPRPEVAEMANEIIATQNQEIALMKRIAGSLV